MKRIIKYKAINPYYSDITHTFIGSTAEEIDNIQDETEEYMKGEHFSLSSIYEREWIVDETDPEFNETLKGYRESQEWLDNYNKLMDKLDKYENKFK